MTTPRTLRDLLGRWAPPGAAGDRLITGVTDDSRAVRPGMVFVAIRGETTDGHRFLEQVSAAGAGAVVAQQPPERPLAVPCVQVPDTRLALAELADRWHGHPTRPLCMVGVTGTDGKTTTTYLLESILRAAGRHPAVVGTIAYRYGGRGQRAGCTTPPPLTLFATLAEMARAGAESVVIEVSSHALVQQRVAPIAFQAGVFTNLGADHLDFHKSVEAYFEAKATLFASLTAEAAAVLNADDPRAEALRARTRARVVTFGLDGPAECTASRCRPGAEGTRFVLRIPVGQQDVSLPLLGMHNVRNALGAAAAAWSVGVDLAAIARGIETVGVVPGRLEPIQEGQPFRIFVDYAHTEAALRAAVGALRAVRGRGRVFVLFGCGGDRDQTKRPAMGRVVGELADVAVLTSDNPRTEDPMAILDQVEAGIPRQARVLRIPDRRMAIRTILALAQEGDVVLLAGKGHETGQVLRDQTVPFDDRVVARQVLAELLGRRDLVAAHAARLGMVVPAPAP